MEAFDSRLSEARAVPSVAENAVVKVVARAAACESFRFVRDGMEEFLVMRR